LNHRPHPYQFIPGTRMPTQTQAVATVRRWPDGTVYGSAVVSWRCQSPRRLTRCDHRSVESYRRIRYLLMCPLTCRNATQRCAVGGSVERRCAAKMRPRWPGNHVGAIVGRPSRRSSQRRLTALEAVGPLRRYLGRPTRGVLLGPRLVHAEDARPLHSLRPEAGVALPEKRKVGGSTPPLTTQYTCT
jgi:hypothetical protein